MQRASTFLAAVLGLLAVDVLHAADPGSNPVFTNKVRFRIPFRYDSGEMEKLQAREVQLFMSLDHGSHWKLAEKADPHADHFDFQAPCDGEYWFAVRTMDAFNRLHPPGNDIEAGLKVVIDATPPVLELVLAEIEPGKVELRWMAADDHLDATKLRLEYRQPDSPNWQPVGVVPQPNGQTTWTVPSGGLVAVRGTIGDSAGNAASAEKELQVHPAAAASQKGAATEYRAPVAASQQTIPTAPQSQRIIRSAPPAAVVQNGRGPNVGGDAVRLDQGFFTQAIDGVPRIQPRARENLVSESRTLRPAAATTTQPSETPTPATSPVVPGDFNSAAAADRSTASGQPNADAPRTVLVNSHDFQIGYRVDDVGPSGVSKVELFITPDGGLKWYRYGADPDNRSPLQVSVPDDGVYGFELRVKNGAGIGDDPPRPGDKPSIIVTVDKTPPVAELLAPQVGRGKSRNKVLLQWTASDSHLGPAPILLEYAVQTTGPWKKIGDWQANAGQYVWSVEQGLPGKVFLRLTVKDEAGNITQSTAADPLVIDFARPTARIVDIEAKTDNQQRN